ncbi:MAG: phage GP46 family protein [Treponema sp.]|jgi:phage gp46-like protein|nr:phage GP46 family protein [Treponema sp.]
MEQDNKPIAVENWADIRELARMSIGTDKGTWQADPDFGSELWLLKKTGKVDGQTAGVLERMIRESLQWLIEDKLADTVSCAAERNGKNRIDYRVTVTRPDGSLVTVEEAWGVV